MRTGLLDEGNLRTDAAVDDIIALLAAFQREALVVAGRYTLAKRRRTVTAPDMKASLQYVARTFFERNEQELSTMMARERTAMEEDEEGESEEESEEEESDDQESEEGEDDVPDAVATDSDRALARHVDVIATSWHLWNPDDPVLQMIKRAIDQTPI